MYLIVEIKGKQYKIAEDGKTFDVDYLGEDVKDFGEVKVLFLSSDKEIKVGQPYLDKIKVELSVVGNKPGKKIKVLRKKVGRAYSRMQGHRQKYTQLKVNKISIG